MGISLRSNVETCCKTLMQISPPFPGKGSLRMRLQDYDICCSVLIFDFTVPESFSFFSVMISLHLVALCVPCIAKIKARVELFEISCCSRVGFDLRKNCYRKNFPAFWLHSSVGGGQHWQTKRRFGADFLFDRRVFMMNFWTGCKLQLYKSSCTKTIGNPVVDEQKISLAPVMTKSILHPVFTLRSIGTWNI